MQRLITGWCGLEQRVVDKAINNWHGRLRASSKISQKKFVSHSKCSKCCPSSLIQAACMRADGQLFSNIALRRKLFLTDFTVL